MRWYAKAQHRESVALQKRLRDGVDLEDFGSAESAARDTYGDAGHERQTEDEQQVTTLGEGRSKMHQV